MMLKARLAVSHVAISVCPFPLKSTSRSCYGRGSEYGHIGSFLPNISGARICVPKNALNIFYSWGMCSMMVRIITVKRYISYDVTVKPHEHHLDYLYDT